MPQLPLVLAHGIFRFDALRVFLRDHGGVDIGPHYFNGVADLLRRNGIDAEESDVSFCGSLKLRAQQLAADVNGVLSRSGAAQVDIIAHSMGGLDARKAIVDEGLATKVRTLTTIGTPHLGTTSADLALEIGGRIFIAALLPVLDLEGFSDLTTSACAAFNRRAVDAEVTNGVRYRTVTATAPLLQTNPLLQATSVQLGGDSDGIVPAASQRWTNRLTGSNGTSKIVDQLAFPIAADHLNEIALFANAANGDRIRTFYLTLAKSA